MLPFGPTAHTVAAQGSCSDVRVATYLASETAHQWHDASHEPAVPTSQQLASETALVSLDSLLIAWGLSQEPCRAVRDEKFLYTANG